MVRGARRLVVCALALLVVGALMPGAAGVVGVAAATPDVSSWDGDLPDPAIVADGDGYLAFGTTTADLHVPVARSNDLRNWSLAGDALPTLPAWASLRSLVWAPGVAHIGGLWRLYFTLPHRELGVRCLSVATSAVAAGPYVDSSREPLVCDRERGGAIDPSPFIDVGGTPWLLWKSEGMPGDVEAALWSQRLTSDGLGLQGPRHGLLERQLDWEWPLVENPALVRWGNGYLLLYSAGMWATDGYRVGAARCAGPAGPCSRLGSGPVLSTTHQVAGPGGQSFFFDGRGRPWVAFHAWTPGRVGYEHGGARSLAVTRLAGTFGDLVVDGRPHGAFDGVSAAAGGLRVRGWAVDPDTDRAVAMRVSIDGRDVGSRDAASRRPDVDISFPGSGPDHGLDSIFGASPGYHTVCVVVANVGLGRDEGLGCRGFTRPVSPFGAFDTAIRVDAGTMIVRGWAIDPDTASALAVHVWVDGRPVTSLPASFTRRDVGAAHPGFGLNHGFDAAVALNPGRHTVCLHAINVGPGGNRLLGCRAV